MQWVPSELGGAQERAFRRLGTGLYNIFDVSFVRCFKEGVEGGVFAVPGVAPGGLVLLVWDVRVDAFVSAGYWVSDHLDGWRWDHSWVAVILYCALLWVYLVGARWGVKNLIYVFLLIIMQF